MAFRLIVKNEAEVRAAIAKADKDIKRILETAVDAGAELIEDVFNATGWGSGHGRETVNKRKTRVEMNIGPDKAHWYYRFKETGAQRHAIVGSGGALSFGVGGAQVIVRSVNHPGVAKSPYMRPGLRNNKSNSQNKIGDRFKEVLP